MGRRLLLLVVVFVGVAVVVRGLPTLGCGIMFGVLVYVHGWIALVLGRSFACTNVCPRVGWGVG